MKLFGKIILGTTLLMLLTACGKENKSGQSSYNYSNPYCMGGYGCNQSYYGAGNIGAINSPYALVNTAQAENPCVAGSYYANQRIPIQTQIVTNSVVATNDIFVGVTSYGDVAAIIGNGTRNPILVAYICPRSNMSGQGQISTPVLGATSVYCRNAKPITAMNMMFPDGYMARFRDPGFGSSAGRPFTFCQ